MNVACELSLNMTFFKHATWGLIEQSSKVTKTEVKGERWSDRENEAVSSLELRCWLSWHRRLELHVLERIHKCETAHLSVRHSSNILDSKLRTSLSVTRQTFWIRNREHVPWDREYMYLTLTEHETKRKAPGRALPLGVVTARAVPPSGRSPSAARCRPTAHDGVLLLLRLTTYSTTSTNYEHGTTTKSQKSWVKNSD